MVTCQLLGTVVAAGQAGDAHLTDTEGLHLAQVFFEHQAPQRQRLVIHACQQRLKGVCRGDDLLTASCASQYRFDPQRAVEQQQLCGSASVGFAEHGVAAQQGIAGLSGKVVGPARREAGLGG